VNQLMPPIWHHHCVLLNCPEGDNQYCNIPLPHQSPLGIYEGLQYRPMGEWPATFLCLRHGRVSAYLPDSVHYEIEPIVPGQPLPPMWKIECACAHENRGRLHTIYTGRIPSAAELLRRVMRIKPEMACGDHLLIWREDLMRVTELAHESPMP
jgi:hypothetical protein